MNTISCLWIQKHLDETSIGCITSWLRLNYKITIYTYALPHNFTICNTICHDPRVEVLDANTIFPYPSDPTVESHPLPVSDMFRYQLLDKTPQCFWLDTDIFLLRRLPERNFLCSEYSNRSGAFIPKDREKTAMIGAIGQIVPIVPWKKIIHKCQTTKLKQGSNQNNFQKLFQRIVHKDFMGLVEDPHAFCPIPWSFAKELYEKTSIGDKDAWKFGVKCPSLQDILENPTIFGVHLWRNLSKVKKVARVKNSVFDQIMELNKPRFKLCIPSYNRAEFLGETTLKYLKDSIRIEEYKQITIFVSTEENKKEYQLLYPDLDVVLVPEDYKGIGAVRHYITNRWAHHGEQIVLMDDDITTLKGMDGSPIKDMSTLIEKFFTQLIGNNLFFGGVPLCTNTYFMKDNYTTNLKYCSGALQFIRIDKSRTEIDCWLRHMEDYYFNIKYFIRDGGILRLNSVAPITKNYNSLGGICDEMGGLDKRLEDGKKAADKICEEFPGYVSQYKKKKGRGPECVNLRLNHMARNK